MMDILREKKEKDDGHFLVKHCPWRIYTKQTFFLPRGYASKIFSKSLSSTHYSIGWNLWVSSNTCETPHDLVGPISKILRPIWISIYRTQCVSYFIGCLFCFKPGSIINRRPHNFCLNITPMLYALMELYQYGITNFQKLPKKFHYKMHTA
jgi:hypothetical protein